MEIGLFKVMVVLALFLGQVGFAFSRPDFFQRELPLELKLLGKGTPPRNAVRTEPLTINQLRFTQVKGGQVNLSLPDSRSLVMDGMPIVPQLLRLFKVDPNQQVEAKLENIVLEETSLSVPISKSAEAYVWKLNKPLRFNSQSKQRYFPGKLIESHQNKGALYVNLFPVQVDLETGKVLKVISADIKVVYGEKDISLSWGELFSFPSVIITSDKLLAAAEVLKNYHEQKLGIKTTIVTVEAIDSSEKPISEDELPSGYKEKEDRDNFVKAFEPEKKAGYDYELAKKISNFLQNRMGDSSPLRYVTILGDSQMVPPSYYFAYRSNLGRNFTPTDACYGAVKQCRAPKVAVGRLPLQDIEGVKGYIQKVEAWRAFAESAQMELSLFGGKAFSSADIYVGELGALNTIQDTKYDWHGVKKNFRTKKTYTKKKLMELVEGSAETPFSYHLDHGDGNRWFVDADSISSKEIAAVTPLAHHPSLMVSISCVNAAFDEAITKESLYGDNSLGELSVGTSLVNSKAGVVAYLGAARQSVGMPIYDIDQFGNLESKGSNYGLQILETFYQKYGVLRMGRIGDFSLKALQAFVFEYGNDLAVDQNAWSYFITELLGDPVIPMPNRIKQDESFAIGKSNLKLDNSVGFGFPVLHLKDFLENQFPVSILQSVEASLFRVLKTDFGGYLGEEMLTSQSIIADEKAHLNLDSVAPLKEGTYFLRLENTVGVPRERQIHFSVD